MINMDKLRDTLVERLAESKLLSTQDPFKSFEIAEEVLSIAKKNKMNTLIGEAYFHLAYACRVMSKYTMALEHAFQAIQIFNINKDREGIVKASNIIGIIYFYHGDYSSANTYYSKALDLAKDLDMQQVKASILNNIGELYRLSEQGFKANKYYFEALDITIKEQLKNNTAIILSNIGEVYYNNQDFKNSFKYLTEGYNLAKEEKNNFLAIGEIETKLGLLMYSKKDYLKASSYYALAFEHLNLVDNKFYLIDLLINMSILEETLGNQPETYLNEALDMAVRLELHPKISRIFKLLGEFHEKNHEYKEALNYCKAHFMKEKEIEASHLSTRLNIMALEFKYDQEKKQSQRLKDINSKFKTEIKRSHKELEEIKSEYKKVLSESSIDELTQISNRRGIRQLIVEKTQELSAYKYAVYMVDIDFFKKYNDVLGHMQGDICLQMIAKHLKNLEYEDYFIGRFGGEEFLCYAKVKDIQEACELGETIRKTVSDLDLTYTFMDEIQKITVSVGGKISNDLDRDMNVLIRGADEALYQAKNKGRNQILVS